MNIRGIVTKPWFPIVAFITTVTVVAVMVAILCPIAALDTFSRYAVMAEAFAAGNWKEAFHPRFGVGFPVLSGMLCRLTGMDGYRCCTAVSTLVWAIGLIPVFRLTRRIFGETAAWFAVILYAFCPQTLIWGLKGFRDSFRVAGILFFVAGIVARRFDPRAGLLEAMTGFALLTLFRGDAVLQAGVLALVFAGVDGLKLKTALLACWSMLVLQPSCWLVWSWTRSWVPVYEGVWILRRLFGG